MNFVRNKGKKLTLSVMTGVFACILSLGCFERRMAIAWWGILYPEYCFMEVEEEEKEELKISFWLAKVFDW